MVEAKEVKEVKEPEVKEVKTKEDVIENGSNLIKETLGKIKESEEEVVKEDDTKGKPTEAKKEEVEEGDDKVKEVTKKETEPIPYHRFAEVNEEKKALKQQMNAMQGQMRMMQELIIQKGDKVSKSDRQDTNEKYAKEIAEEQDMDIESARKLTKKMSAMVREGATELVSKELSALKNQTSGLLVNQAITEALEKYPRGKTYKKDVYDVVMGLKIDLRTNPDVIIDAAKLVVADKVDEIEKQAEERALKKHSEQKKIVVSGVESPGGSPAKSVEELTDAQKAMARKYGVSEEKYAANMRKVS